MREDFLHFLWRWRRFEGRDLTTTDGQSLEILHPGTPNTDAGPDFFNARLRIGGVEWAANVEIHLRSSDWLAHRHDSNRAYDNVALHVVLDDDQPIFRSDGQRIPCLALRERLPARILAHYHRLENERAWIPCAHFYPEIPDIIRLNWLDRLLVERLEQKTTAVSEALAQTENHWEEVFYRSLARNFGLKINAEPFEALARSLPMAALAKHKNSLFQLEALLFGQAGLLEGDFSEEYPRSLAKEYRFLRQKFGLETLEGSQWKFLRLRPANFPTVRLAQFAALVFQSAHLFSKILEAEQVRNLQNLFEARVSDYWLTHYHFDKISPKRSKFLGRDFVNVLIINTIVPFLFHYGQVKKLPEYREKALRLLEELPAETNHIIEAWEKLGSEARNAYQSQALLQLKNQYCAEKRCLDCGIGLSILK